MYICFYIHNWFGQITGIALTCGLNFTSVQNWYTDVESSLCQLVVKYYKNRKIFTKDNLKSPRSDAVSETHQAVI